MLPDTAKATFEGHLRGLDLTIASVRPAEGLDAMFGFYRDVRADGCRLESDGDMLLFQWGTYDWGNGEHFELDITRQLVSGSGEDEDVWQLHLTFRFAPEATLRAQGAGNRWCHSPSELEDFAALVRASPAYGAVMRRSDGVADLAYESAG